MRNNPELFRRLECRRAALAAAAAEEWPLLLRLKQVPGAEEFLRRYPPRLIRLLSARPLAHRRAEVMVSRVLPATFTAAWASDGWRIDVTARTTDPRHMPLRLVSPVTIHDVAELARALADPGTARRMTLTCRGHAPIPLCLEAGFATAPGRLWLTQTEWSGQSLTVCGWDWPIVLLLRLGDGPWSLTAARAARWNEVRRIMRRRVGCSPLDPSS